MNKKRRWNGVVGWPILNSRRFFIGGGDDEGWSDCIYACAHSLGLAAHEARIVLYTYWHNLPLIVDRLCPEPPRSTLIDAVRLAAARVSQICAGIHRSWICQVPAQDAGCVEHKSVTLSFIAAFVVTSALSQQARNTQCLCEHHGV